MMKGLSAICTAAVVLIASPAVAEDGKATFAAMQNIANQTIQIQDRDGDHLISLKESSGAALALFGTIDADGNGAISPAEMLSIAKGDVAVLRISDTDDQSQALVAARFQAMDIDGDGAVSLPEMLAVNQTVFDTADANADGFVSQTELLSLADMRSHPEEPR